MLAIISLQADGTNRSRVYDKALVERNFCYQIDF